MTFMMELRIILVTIMMVIGVKAGLDVEDLIARGFTCSLADSRYYFVLAVQYLQFQFSLQWPGSRMSCLDLVWR